MLVIDGTHFCKFLQKHNQQVNQDKQTAPAKKKFSFYFFGWVLKHFGEQNSQRFPHFFQTTLLNLPN